MMLSCHAFATSGETTPEIPPSILPPQTRFFPSGELMPANVIVVDEQAMFRAGLCRMLSQLPWLSIIAEFSDASELRPLLQQGLPDIVIYDPYHKKTRNFQPIADIRSFAPAVKLVVLTESDDADDMLQAAKHGVHGYFTKNTPFKQFELSLHDIHLGKVRISEGLGAVLFKRLARPSSNKELTQREQEIFRLLEKGLSNKHIALKLNISLYTVKNHVSSVMRKCNLTTRYQLLGTETAQDSQGTANE